MSAKAPCQNSTGTGAQNSSGANILTNVTGLNVEKIHEYLRKQGQDDAKFGEIVELPPIEKCAGRFAVIDEYQDEDGKFKTRLDEQKSLIRGGDILVLDEVWRIWKRGAKIAPEDEMLWRMHRHILNSETHVSTDIVLITQNWGDLNLTLRGLVHQRFVMKKHTSLGLVKRYAVFVYDQGARSAHLTFQKKYRQEVFDLYKSHSMGDGAGKEQSVDERGNYLRYFLINVFPFVVVLLLAGGYFVWRYWQPETHAKRVQGTGTAGAAPVVAVPAGQPGQSFVGADGRVVPGAIVPITDSNDRYGDERVLGYVADGTNVIFFIELKGRGVLQRIASDKATISGQYVETTHDGKIIGTFTGPEKTEKRGSQ